MTEIERAGLDPEHVARMSARVHPAVWASATCADELELTELQEDAAALRRNALRPGAFRVVLAIALRHTMNRMLVVADDLCDFYSGSDEESLWREEVERIEDELETLNEGLRFALH